MDRTSYDMRSSAWSSDVCSSDRDWDESDITFSTVGPSWCEQVTYKAVRALVWFFIAIALYIAWRLEWKMAVGALASVAHDLAICVGFYAVFQIEVTPATVIAFLTILGYSLYDTIVVFDRMQENEAKLKGTGRVTYKIGRAHV